MLSVAIALQQSEFIMKANKFTEQLYTYVHMHVLLMNTRNLSSIQFQVQVCLHFFLQENSGGIFTYFRKYWGYSPSAIAFYGARIELFSYQDLI